MDQAENRAHRMGMETEHLSIYQLYALNSIDEKMKNILEEKKKIFAQLIEKDIDIEKQTQSTIKELINSFIVLCVCFSISMSFSINWANIFFFSSKIFFIFSSMLFKA